MNKTINRLYFNSLRSKGSSTKTKQSVFETHWGFKTPIKSRKAEELNKHDTVLTDNLILDVDDSDNVENALQDSIKIMEYLKQEYNTHSLLYFSGLKGFHVVIPFSPMLELRTVQGKGKSNIVYAYHSLISELEDKLGVKTLDHSLQEVTRIIQLPNVLKDKNEKDRGYKIVINKSNKLDKIKEYSIEDIKEASKENRNICEFPFSARNSELKYKLENVKISENTINIKEEKKENMRVKETETGTTANIEEKERLNATLNSSGVATDNNYLYKPIINVYNALLRIHDNKERHKIIGLIGSSFNGYVTIEDVNNIYNALQQHTDIEESDNALNSLKDAYNSDSEPLNIGQVANALKDTKFKQIIKEYEECLLHLKTNNEEKKRKEEMKQDYETIKEMIQEKGLLQILHENLTSYQNNELNISKGLAYGYLAGTRQYSTFLNLNTGAGEGKTAYCKTLGKLLPNYEKENIGTSSSYFRQDPYHYDGKVIDIGDVGLMSIGKDRKAQLDEIIGILGELITDNVCKKPVSVKQGDDWVTETLEIFSNGLLVLQAQPYTNVKRREAGEQIDRRQETLLINPLNYEEGEEAVINSILNLNDDTTFKKEFKNFMQHSIEEITELNIKKEENIKIIKEVYKDCKGNKSNTTRQYLLFKAVIILNCVEREITIEDYNSFKKIYLPKQELNPIEAIYYKWFVKNIPMATMEQIAEANQHIGMLEQNIIRKSTDRKNKPFFTYKSIRNAFNNNIKMNKKTKDTLNNIPDILEALYETGYIEKLDLKYQGLNVYYVPYNEKKEEKEDIQTSILIQQH